nr:ATP-binding protein [Rhodoferax sp. BLA1]
MSVASDSPTPQDLTEQLAQLQCQLDASRAELQEFTYVVSHDLRAPLRHIHAYAQIIAEDWPDLPDDLASHLGTIRQAAQLLTRQLDGLAQLSRLGTQVIDLQPVSVGALAREVADELVALHPDVDVLWQLAGDVPPVLADPCLLRQVLQQLLGNALKFSRGRCPAQIALGWQFEPAPSAEAEAAAPAGIRLTLRDNGVGFRPEQAQALFKVFGRLHPACEFEGLGLGLLLCRRILERLGGAIQITATPDQGCEVAVCLPVAPDHS